MKCPECKKEHITKAGVCLTRKGRKQRYQCKDCARIFYKDGDLWKK